MSRIIFHITAYTFLVLGLCGCPLLNSFLEMPESAFEASPTSGGAPLTVLFVDASVAGTTNISEWQWDFGDGSTSTSRNPSHIYEAPGSYTVSLTVTTTVGTHTALRQNYVNVVQPPTADFTAMPVLGTAPLSVVFSDTSDPGSSAITSWQWNFGDRTPTSGVQSPTHIYTAPGLYTVSLSVTTDVGTDVKKSVQLVNVSGSPVADFSTTFTPGTAPLTVMFTDKSDAGTAAVTGWAWDFGDGGMSMDQNPTYTYLTPGVYTVSLTIMSEVGEDMVVKEKAIRVEEGPAAAFAGEPVMGSAPLTVTFSDTSKPGSSAISNWLWDFGDGGLLSTRQNPTRVYTVPGVYTVSLKVTTPVGTNILKEEDYITVLPGVAFTGNQTPGDGTVTVQFVDQSPTGDFEISAWAWEFGDGGMSDKQNPEHLYEAPGIYDVALTITTDLGDSITTLPAFVTVVPATAFSAAPTSGPPPLEVTFTDETEAGSFEISAWAWDFGDSTSSAEQSPVHLYETPGVYAVSLTTTTENGSTTEAKSNLIAVEPVVAFGANKTTGQGTLTVEFEDQTNAGNLNILTRLWDFGDGMGSTDTSPTHTYQNIGSYTVSLRVTTVLGETTTTEMDYIQVGPIVDFSTDVKQGTGTLMVTFSDLTKAGSLEITGWAWDFGDGGASDERNPVHEYMPGQFSVGLTVTTSQGDTTTTKANLILVAPKVTIDRVQPAGPAPFEASLLDLTMPGAFDVTKWDWNFGDGGSSEVQNPVHVFVNPGTYTVTLTITTDGGVFSVTEPNFIVSQRGPTAIFSHVVIRGATDEDPVIVSFTNSSTAGDSPILNQTWDFGASAIFAEEDAEELNPTVIYPGLAFKTIPQDVSLTVRTFIAADTALKPNLYGAPVTKEALSEDVLWQTEFSVVATNGSGAVWAAGSLEGADGANPDTVIVQLGPDASPQWNTVLASEISLEVSGLAVSDTNELLVSGTLQDSNQSIAYLACYDGRGAQRWERLFYGAPALQGLGVSMDESNQFVMLTRTGSATDSGTMTLVSGDLSGGDVTLVETGMVLQPGMTAVAAINQDTVLVGDGTGGVVKAILGKETATLDEWLPGSQETTSRNLTLIWNGEREILRRSWYEGDVVWLENTGTGSQVKAPFEVGTAHTIDKSGNLIWLERDNMSEAWVIRRRGPK